MVVSALYLKLVFLIKQPKHTSKNKQYTIMGRKVPSHNILTKYPLESLNSFNVPAISKFYIQINTLKDIEYFCSAVDLKKTKFYILGGGSNTLFVGDFLGYILHVKLQGIQVIQETNHEVLVRAAAGVIWNDLVLFCLSHGYGGIENLSMIPGTVGAAPIQNIGAYGVEIKDVIDSVETIELSTCKNKIFKKSECGFGYRTSVFKKEFRNQFLITGIVLALHKERKFSTEYGDIRETLKKMNIKALSFQAVSDAVIAIRKNKLPDPSFLGNAGSFFQNPLISAEQYKSLKIQYPDAVSFSMENNKRIKISAAWLIEKAGFKGLKKGKVGVYYKHPLILVNYGGATGNDVLYLANQIKKKVFNQFDVELIPEVNILGETVD